MIVIAAIILVFIENIVLVINIFILFSIKGNVKDPLVQWFGVNTFSRKDFGSNRTISVCKFNMLPLLSIGKFMKSWCCVVVEI